MSMYCWFTRKTVRLLFWKRDTVCTEPHSCSMISFWWGPKNDPAGIREKKSVSKAIESIAVSKVSFVSRGDDSGTHKKELGLWRQVGIEPDGTWYREAGQGMGKTLQIADELQAYTLTDRGTWLFNQDKLDLEVVFEGDQALHNQYSVIAVNPDLHQTNHGGAMAFSNWVVSQKGQVMINQYHINGQQLFHANGGSGREYRRDEILIVHGWTERSFSQSEVSLPEPLPPGSNPRNLSNSTECVNAVYPCMFLVVGVDDIPRRLFDVGVCEHEVFCPGVFYPAIPRFEIHRAEFPAFGWIV